MTMPYPTPRAGGSSDTLLNTMRAYTPDGSACSMATCSSDACARKMHRAHAWHCAPKSPAVLDPGIDVIVDSPADALWVGLHCLQEPLHLIPRRHVAGKWRNRRLVAHENMEHAFMNPRLHEHPLPEAFREVQHLPGQDLRGPGEQPDRDVVLCQGFHQLAAPLPAEPVGAEHGVPEERLRAEVLLGARPGQDRVEVCGPRPADVARVPDRAVGVADVGGAPAGQVHPGADEEHRLDQGQELWALSGGQHQQGQSLACSRRVPHQEQLRWGGSGGSTDWIHDAQPLQVLEELRNDLLGSVRSP
mmetsp:Transcript_25521/g.66651  ORF Transcript_25521/g.66651 Transcript_25521/m.66651 type:complete len:303 (-) Transcript_25521:565-1473(-)